MTDLLLVRHGETAWNKAGRLQGWAPISLSERGERQAKAVSTHIDGNYDVSKVITSDLPRTRETAQHIADTLGGNLETDRRWRERDFGIYQGLESQTFFHKYPHMDLVEAGERAAKVVPDSGENWFGVESRVIDALESLLAQDKSAVVVTHAGPIRLALAELKGLDIVDGLVHQSAENCSLTRIGVIEEPSVIFENKTSFLK